MNNQHKKDPYIISYNRSKVCMYLSTYTKRLKEPDCELVKRELISHQSSLEHQASIHIHTYVCTINGSIVIVFSVLT